MHIVANMRFVFALALVAIVFAQEEIAPIETAPAIETAATSETIAEIETIADTESSEAVEPIELPETPAAIEPIELPETPAATEASQATPHLCADDQSGHVRIAGNWEEVPQTNGTCLAYDDWCVWVSGTGSMATEDGEEFDFVGSLQKCANGDQAMTVCSTFGTGCTKLSTFGQLSGELEVCCCKTHMCNGGDPRASTVVEPTIDGVPLSELEQPTGEEKPENQQPEIADLDGPPLAPVAREGGIDADLVPSLPTLPELPENIAGEPTEATEEEELPAAESTPESEPTAEEPSPAGEESAHAEPESEHEPIAEGEAIAAEPHAESEPNTVGEHATGAHPEPSTEIEPEYEPKSENEPTAEHDNNVIVAEAQPAPIETAQEDEELNDIFHPKAGHNKRKANGASTPVASMILVFGAFVALRR